MGMGDTGWYEHGRPGCGQDEQGRSKWYLMDLSKQITLEGRYNHRRHTRQSRQ